MEQQTGWDKWDQAESCVTVLWYLGWVSKQSDQSNYWMMEISFPWFWYTQLKAGHLQQSSERGKKKKKKDQYKYN